MLLIFATLFTSHLHPCKSNFSSSVAVPKNSIELAQTGSESNTKNLQASSSGPNAAKQIERAWPGGKKISSSAPSETKRSQHPTHQVVEPEPSSPDSGSEEDGDECLQLEKRRKLPPIMVTVQVLANKAPLDIKWIKGLYFVNNQQDHLQQSVALQLIMILHL